MNMITLRLPDSLYEQVRELSTKEAISIELFITLAVTEKVSALLTEEYLEQRAKDGTKKKFRRALSNVPDVEPDEEDKV